MARTVPSCLVMGGTPRIVKYVTSVYTHHFQHRVILPCIGSGAASLGSDSSKDEVNCNSGSNAKLDRGQCHKFNGVCEKSIPAWPSDCHHACFVANRQRMSRRNPSENSNRDHAHGLSQAHCPSYLVRP